MCMDRKDDVEAKIKNVCINKQYMNNTKLARILAVVKPDEQGEYLFSLKISDNVTNHITLNYNGKTAIDQKDLVVLDAVMTITISGYMSFSIEQLAKVITGNMKYRLTDVNREKLANRIEKLKSISIRIDCTEEFNAYHSKKGRCENYIIESALLPVSKEKGIYKVNGKMTEQYVITTNSALFEYAKFNNQIIAIPVDVFNSVANRVGNTEDSVLVRRYVIKKVYQITNKKNRINNKLALFWNKSRNEFGGMLPELGYWNERNSTSWRKKKSKIMTLVELALDELIKQKVIKKYSTYREDGTTNPASAVQGYVITV